MRNQHSSTGQTESRQSPRNLTLNLTSMIDVVFLLLVYFVLSVAFVSGEGVLTARFPTRSEGQDPFAMVVPPVRVSVTSAGSQGTGYRLDVERSPTAPSSFGELATLLESMQTRRGGFVPSDARIIIAPTNAVQWQHVVNAFNAAVRARYTNIAFAQAP